MANEWDRTRFAQLCEHSAFGPRFAGENYAVDGNVATLRTTDISADGRIEYETMPLARLDLIKLRQHTLLVNDLVITRSGRIGTAALFTGFRLPVLPGAFLIRFRLKTGVAEPLFYRYFFNSPTGQELLTSVATGSVQQNLNITSVHGLEVPVPPLPEQRAIAHILGTLDDKIELNRRMNETLEAMARALFKSWFVDFNPVRAKAESRDPGLPKHLADLFPDRLADSELGKIPEGWEVKQLVEICTLGRGASPRPINDYMNGEVPWVKIADATAASGPFLFETKERLRTAGVRKSITVSPGDLILSNSATCGIPIFVELHGCIHDGWLYFKNLKSISKLYLYQVLIDLGDHLFQIADGSVQKNLNINLVGQQYILVPPAPLVEAFDMMTVNWFSKIRHNGIESRTLAALRDALLPKLISGELRIKDAERFMEKIS